jgi:hypothetical protein
MKPRHLYLLLCVLGLLLPLSQFIPWLLEHGVDLARFINDLFANRISAFFGLDVIVSALALIVFVLVTGRKENVPHLWVRGDKGVLYTGSIEWGSARALEDFLSARPQVASLEIDSPGGNFQEASRIAELVKARRLATFVRSECLSACTLAFAAGRPRIAMISAKFGFHRASVSSLLVSNAALEDEATEQYARALRSDGVDGRFVDQAVKIVPPQIWIPGRNDLKVSKFVEYFVE